MPQSSPLSPNEIRDRALRFAREWQGERREKIATGSRKAQAGSQTEDPLMPRPFTPLIAVDIIIELSDRPGRAWLQREERSGQG